MADELLSNDDDGFLDYVPTAIDPGYTILVATTIFCLVSNTFLPCLVSLGRRYEKRRIAREEDEKMDDDDSEQSHQEEKVAAVTTDAVELVENQKKPEEESAYVPASYVHGGVHTKAAGGGDGDHKNSPWKSLIDQIIMPPYPDERSVIGGSALVGGGGRPASSAVSEVAGGEDNRSSLTFVTAASGTSSFWDATILDAGGFGTRNKTRGLRRQRRVLRDKELRRKDQLVELAADRKEYASLVITDADGIEHVGMTASQLVGIDPGATACRSEVASRVSSHVYSRSSGGMRSRGRKRGEGSALSSGLSRRRGYSPEPSILSRLEDHAILPNDAADADDPGYYILPKPAVEDDQEIDLCCGKRAWWKPTVLGEGFGRLVNLAEYDHEMKRIVKLCIPYSITALLEGIVDSIVVALIAQYIGTEAVAAFTIVQLILGLTSEFLGGILGTEATLCSHAIGAGNFKLAGQTVQVCAILFTVLMIPNMIVWSFFVDDIILLFGFNEETAYMGQQYARILVIDELLVGLNLAYSGLLNVIGYENFATYMSVAEGLVKVGATAALVLLRDATLMEVGLVHMAGTVVFFLLTVWISICWGRMGKYVDGMVGSCVLVHNTEVVRNVVRTAVPLAFGYLLEYGEWEILTIFAAFMGPAEVAAWGILGTLWETFESLSVGIADGGEVRCAYHLGNANPGMAQIAAYKSILLSVCASFFFTSVLFIIGENLAVFFTPDPTLQHLIADLLPLLGVGNIFLTAGSVSWALVGAQARYRLATLVAFVSSWCVTMPLAAILTYGFNINLQGITCSVVVGYSVTCTILFYILLRSDWERISKHVVELNDDSDSDDESSVDPAEQTQEVS